MDLIRFLSAILRQFSTNSVNLYNVLKKITSELQVNSNKIPEVVMIPVYKNDLVITANIVSLGILSDIAKIE